MARVFKRGNSPVYYGEYYLGDQRVRFSTASTNRREAQAEADERERQASHVDAQRQALTFREAIALFFQIKSLKPRTIEGYERSFAEILGTLGDFTLASLTDQDISKFIRERSKASALQARADLRALSSLFSAVKTMDPCITKNPIKEFDKSGLPTARKRTSWLREDEIELVLSKCKQPRHRLFIILAVDTGMRKTEMLELKWAEVDLRAGVIHLGNRDYHRTKTGIGREIPLTERLRSELQDHILRGHSRDEYVFQNPETGAPYRTLKTFWRRLVRDTNLEGLRIHDLRHTFGTRAVHAGVDMITQMDIMGHRDPSSYKRYSHASSESRKQAIEKIQLIGSKTMPEPLVTEEPSAQSRHRTHKLCDSTHERVDKNEQTQEFDGTAFPVRTGDPQIHNPRGKPR